MHRASFKNMRVDFSSVATFIIFKLKSIILLQYKRPYTVLPHSDLNKNKCRFPKKKQQISNAFWSVICGNL